MAVARRLFAGGAVQTTLLSPISATDLTITIVGDTGWPSGAEEFFVVIDPDQATEEKMLVTRSSTVLTAAATAKRGVDGTVAASHSAGAVIYPCVTATDLNDANRVASRLTSGVAGQVAVASADASGFTWTTFKLDDVDDVDTSGVSAGDLLAYDSSSGDWSPVDRAIVVAVQSENVQTGTTYTLALSDLGKLVTLDNGSAITLTVPTNASVAFPVGSRVDIVQLGAGQVTVAGASGVTVNSRLGDLKLFAQYSGASLWYQGSDVWLLVGDLSA
jgi:co-chaperonin GroES (HSP10)